ncbi:MAG: DMT family transporter [Firmicutes bacterium]|nr:DMT family transporter [Bacillota bacterium]
MNRKIRSSIFLFTAPMIWGVAFVMQCMVDTVAVGTLTFNAVRYLLGALSLLPIIFFFEKEEYEPQKFRKTIIYGIITGIILFVASEFQMYGISINKSSGKSGFLTGLYMVIVPFLNLLIYKRKVLLKEWAAAIVATTGLFLLSVSEGFSNVSAGDFMVFVSAFFWAAHILAIDNFVDRVSPVKYSCVQFLTCAVLNGIFATFCEDFSVSGLCVNWLPILYTGVLSTGLGYTFQILGQRDANPNFASIVLASEGVYAALAGAVILSEKMTLKGYTGCVLMFLGTILSQVKLKKSVY